MNKIHIMTDDGLTCASVDVLSTYSAILLESSLLQFDLLLMQPKQTFLHLVQTSVDVHFPCAFLSFKRCLKVS